SSWLFCPSGNAVCGDGFDWSGPTEARLESVDASLRQADERLGDHVDHAGDVLIGFSRGAFLARDLLYAKKRAYKGVIFLGAALSPDAQKLRDAGVQRVVLACGDYDGAKPMMQHAAALLASKGIPARFV